MSRNARYYIVHNLAYGSIIRIYGMNTLAQYLREKDCKFDDKLLRLVRGRNSIDFISKLGITYSVEEALDE